LQAWEASQRSTKEDWMEWMRVFAIELLKESPSPALRACSILAQKYDILVTSLLTPLIRLIIPTLLTC
jgi:FKBP12-rapamycin complex-associated protein